MSPTEGPPTEGPAAGWPAVDRIVVDPAPWATRTAFLACGEVVDLWVEATDRPSLLGAVALGRVTAVNPALASAIVAIPGGEAYLSDRAVVEGERLVVQVVRDAAAGKRAVARAGVELAAGPVVLTRSWMPRIWVLSARASASMCRTRS